MGSVQGKWTIKRLAEHWKDEGQCAESRLADAVLRLAESLRPFARSQLFSESEQAAKLLADLGFTAAEGE